MVMKLNKTEQKLIDRASDRGIIVVTRIYGRGKEGGRVTYGQRELNAAFSLVEKGLIVRLRVEKATLPNGGYTTWVSDHVFITQAFLDSRIEKCEELTHE